MKFTFKKVVFYLSIFIGVVLSFSIFIIFFNEYNAQFQINTAYYLESCQNIKTVYIWLGRSLIIYMCSSLALLVIASKYFSNSSRKLLILIKYYALISVGIVFLIFLFTAKGSWFIPIIIDVEKMNSNQCNWYINKFR